MYFFNNDDSGFLYTINADKCLAKGCLYHDMDSNPEPFGPVIQP